MITSVALLTVVALLNGACAIVNYSPAEPSTKNPAEIHHKHEFLSFSYVTESPNPLNSDPQTLSWEGQVIKGLFEHDSRFMKVIATQSPPAIGTHINVYQTNGPPLSTWCKASAWTLGIIPCYAEGIVYETHFDVLVDNVPKHSYGYDIRRKAIIWTGLLPFLWINLFTTQYKEAFSGNAHQFIADAKRDGFL